MHYNPDSERWQPQQQNKPTEVIKYVTVPTDINEAAWRRAKQLMAGQPANVNVLDQLERIKQLVLSGHPNGQGL